MWITGGFGSTIILLIGVVYYNLKADVKQRHEVILGRLQKINGHVSDHYKHLDDHERRLIREEERRRAHRDYTVGVTKQVDLITRQLAVITRHCIAMHGLDGLEEPPHK
jgi:hypothetical protein